MPALMLVHGPRCEWKHGNCTCTPEEHTDPAAAVAAHEGDAGRMQIVKVTPPPPELPGPVPEWRSQARRHRGIISY
ncbi:MAG TPA: hypothetical protein VGK74_22380 [Symbiobacteriaceae bacterium]|jgi:hypothetical protein